MVVLQYNDQWSPGICYDFTLTKRRGCDISTRAANESLLAWLSWETHRRSTNLANKLDAELIVYDETHRRREIRYLICAAKTIGYLVKHRPTTLIAQNPSLVLCSLLAMLKPLFGFRFVIDAHNHALDMVESQGLSGWTARFCFRKADVAIVTNPVAAQRLTMVQTAVLPDPVGEDISLSVPTSEALEHVGLQSPQRYWVLICSFDPDEPVQEVIDAVMAIPESKRLKLCITGRKAKANDALLAYESSWVAFMDYLSTKDYAMLIANAALLIDLTLYEDGWFAVLLKPWLWVPIMLSDNRVSEPTFKQSALYTKNDTDSIREALEAFLNGNHAYLPSAEERRNAFQARWDDWFAQMQKRSAGNLVDAK